MKILFIDEIEQQQKNPKFFGLGAVIIDSAYYKELKVEFYKNFSKLGWKESEEFKGRYIFSQKGDSSVTIDKRINFVKEVAKLSMAKVKSRYGFFFTYNFEGKSKKNYLFLLSKIIEKIPNPVDQKRDKPVVAILYDSCDIPDEEIFVTVEKKLKNKLILLEKPLHVHSDNKTCGIVIVDIISYLRSWLELFKDEEEAQLQLFEEVSKSRDKDKIKTIKEIFSEIKNVKIIK